MDVLEHAEDDVGLVRSALVGAAEHAYVLITVPAFQSLFSAHDIFLDHKRLYSLRQVEEVVRQAGLEILSTRYFFVFLLPIAATLRHLKQRSEAKSDLKEHSKLVNSTDIPRIPGLLDAIFRLIEARSNEIRSQPTR